MDTKELKAKIVDAARVLQYAQNKPQKEDVLKALKLLNEVISNLEGMSS